MTNRWNVTLDEDGALSGQQAFELYKQGVEVWNEFMDKNPKTFVDFSEFDFSRHQESDEISFSHFLFPMGACFDETRFDCGEIKFEFTNFGDGNVSFERTKFSASVSFWGTIFGNSEVSFNSAKFSYSVLFLDAEFGDGDVSFSNTKFGNGGVSFDGAVFGEGDVSFSNTKFGDYTVSFDEVKFGNGTISFDQTIFGDGTISFDETEFSNGMVSFDEAKLGNGEILFKGTKFGDGDILFSYTEFGSGDVLFVGAKFSNSRVSFQKANFGIGEVSFWNAIFEGSTFNFDDIRCESLNFTNTSFNNRDPTDSETIFSMERAHISQSLLLPNLDFRAFDNVSFRGSYLGALFDIEGSQFGQLPDLTATTINGHFSVDRIHVDTPNTFTEGDSTKARRLKELAKKSEDRKTQLDMLALELDAMTATKQIPWLSRGLNRTYKWVSDYGRSILQPSLGLVFVWFVCTAFYVSVSHTEQHWTNKLMDSAQLSFSQSLPFLSLSRTVTQTSLTALYGTAQAEEKTTVEKQKTSFNNDSLENIGLLQNLLSYICLFFIGLGIRNRFKL